jgi:hypothetical protein
MMRGNRKTSKPSKNATPKSKSTKRSSTGSISSKTAPNTRRSDGLRGSRDGRRRGRCRRCVRRLRARGRVRGRGRRGNNGYCELKGVLSLHLLWRVWKSKCSYCGRKQRGVVNSVLVTGIDWKTAQVMDKKSIYGTVQYSNVYSTVIASSSADLI